MSIPVELPETIDYTLLSLIVLVDYQFNQLNREANMALDEFIRLDIPTSRLQGLIASKQVYSSSMALRIAVIEERLAKDNDIDVSTNQIIEILRYLQYADVNATFGFVAVQPESLEHRQAIAKAYDFNERYAAQLLYTYCLLIKSDIIHDWIGVDDALLKKALAKYLQETHY